MIPIKELKALAEKETLIDSESKMLIHWYIMLTCGVNMDLTNIPITNRQNYNHKLENYVKPYFKSFVID